ncbi:hypothetical protein V8E54_009794 [Elaphomyces granulatus]
MHLGFEHQRSLEILLQQYLKSAMLALSSQHASPHLEIYPIVILGSLESRRGLVSTARLIHSLQDKSLFGLEMCKSSLASSPLQPMHGDTVNHFYQSLPTDLNIYHTYLATLCEEDGQEGREPVGIGSQCGVLEPVTTRQKTCPHQVHERRGLHIRHHKASFPIRLG